MVLGWEIGSSAAIAASLAARSAREFFSNRTRVFIEILWGLSRLGMWGVFALVVPGQQFAEAVSNVSENPVEFLLIGQMAYVFFWSSRGAVTRAVKSSSFPAVWSSPCGLATLIIGKNAWNYAWGSCWLGVSMLFCGLVFAVSIHLTLTSVVVLVEGIFLMLSVELFAAAVVIVTKSRLDPLNWFLDVTAFLVTGLIIPVQMLPAPLHVVASIHPQRYLFLLARRSLGLGETVSELGIDLLTLGATITLLLACSAVLFSWSLGVARSQGTLGHA